MTYNRTINLVRGIPTLLYLFLAMAGSFVKWSGDFKDFFFRPLLFSPVISDISVSSLRGTGSVDEIPITNLTKKP